MILIYFTYANINSNIPNSLYYWNSLHECFEKTLTCSWTLNILETKFYDNIQNFQFNPYILSHSKCCQIKCCFTICQIAVFVIISEFCQILKLNFVRNLQLFKCASWWFSNCLNFAWSETENMLNTVILSVAFLNKGTRAN